MRRWESRHDTGYTACSATDPERPESDHAFLVPVAETAQREFHAGDRATGPANTLFRYRGATAYLV